jgi:hypothetical protein
MRRLFAFIISHAAKIMMAPDRTYMACVSAEQVGGGDLLEASTNDILLVFKDSPDLWSGTRQIIEHICDTSFLTYSISS